MTTIILVILGVLLAAAAVLFVVYYGGDAFGNGATEAEAGRLVSEGAQMEAALELYYRQEGSYPTSGDPVDELIAAGYLTHEPLGTRTQDPERWVIDYDASMIKAHLGFSDNDEVMAICHTARQQLDLPDTGTETNVYRCDGSDSPGGRLSGREPCCIGEPGGSGGAGSEPVYEVFALSEPIGDQGCKPFSLWEVVRGSGPGNKADTHCSGSSSSREAIWQHTVGIPAQYQASVAGGAAKATVSVELEGWSGDSDRGRPYVACSDASGTQIMFKPAPGFVDPSSWTRVSVTADIPSQCTSISYGTMSYRAQGTENSIYYRDFQMKLEGGTGASTYHSIYHIDGRGFHGWNMEVGRYIDAVTDYFSFPSVKPPENMDYTRSNQTIPLPSAFHASIDTGKAALKMSAVVFNWGGQYDKGRYTSVYLDGSGNELGAGPTTGANYVTPSGLGTLYDDERPIPSGARSVRFKMETSNGTRGYTDFNPVNFDLGIRVRQ